MHLYLNHLRYNLLPLKLQVVIIILVKTQLVAFTFKQWKRIFTLFQIFYIEFNLNNKKGNITKRFV